MAPLVIINRMKKLLLKISAYKIVFISVAFLVILSGGCAKKDEKEIKIGAILPLTGSAALLGTETKEGMDIAIEEINRKGGMNGQTIKVIYLDSMNDPKEGISAFRILTEIDKVPVVISSMSSVTKALIPLATKGKVALVATVTAAPKITESSEWVFRNYYTTDVQGEVLAKFVTSKLGLKKIGVLYLNDDYGVTGYHAFKKELEENGGQVVFAEGYEKTEIDLRTHILKLKTVNPEGILIVSYDNALVTALKQIRELKIGSKLFSYSGLADPKILQLSDTSAEGVYVTVSNYDPSNPLDIKQKEFVNAYKQKFGKLPGHYPAFGYDTVMIIAEAIKKDGYESEKIKNALLNISNIDLVLGKISILPNREIFFPQTVKIIRTGSIMPVAQ